VTGLLLARLRLRRRRWTVLAGAPCPPPALRGALHRHPDTLAWWNRWREHGIRQGWIETDWLSLSLLVELVEVNNRVPDRGAAREIAIGERRLAGGRLRRLVAPGSNLRRRGRNRSAT
jgi:hypothetical protein